jgi:AcrR family transcriptional regulator
LSSQHSATKQRTIDAALTLFGEHGVSGTSLQMIADAVGLTKASIYYQFPTKDDIVLAAMEQLLVRLTAAVAEAETLRDPDAALDVLLPVMVDLAVESRNIARFLESDPEIARINAQHARFRDLMRRRDAILRRGRNTADARVRAATVLSAVGTIAAQPLVANLDDKTVRSLFVKTAREILGLGPRPARQQRVR